jgi:ABC-type nitrate/sulfonate/bicarbonate transport system permease component
MYAGIIGMALLGLGFYGVIDLLERRLCKWAAL